MLERRISRNEIQKGESVREHYTTVPFPRQRYPPEKGARLSLGSVIHTEKLAAVCPFSCASSRTLSPREFLGLVRFLQYRKKGEKTNKNTGRQWRVVAPG